MANYQTIYSLSLNLGIVVHVCTSKNLPLHGIEIDDSLHTTLTLLNSTKHFLEMTKL